MKRNITALAATLLLLAPASALAECAWVLWLELTHLPAGTKELSTVDLGRKRRGQIRGAG